MTPDPAAAKSAHEEAKQTVPQPAPLENIAKIAPVRGTPEPDKFVAPLAEAAQMDSPPVPLGDIARQYREQKFAREKQARVEAQPLRPSHVYTNEDLARPSVLTPEDHEVFEAAQKKLPPAVEKRTPEIEAMEQGHFSPSLGDIATLYRRQVPIPQINQPNRFSTPAGHDLVRGTRNCEECDPSPSDCQACFAQVSIAPHHPTLDQNGKSGRSDDHRKARRHPLEPGAAIFRPGPPMERASKI